MAARVPGEVERAELRRRALSGDPFACEALAAITRLRVKRPERRRRERPTGKRAD